MKIISIGMSPDSCSNAIDELKVYQKDADPKMDEICKRLAEIGEIEASARFSIADHGNGGVQVTLEPMENGHKIVASGHDVYFIEFGTGDDVKPHGEVSVPVYPGSWSEQHAKQYSTYGYWFYGGEKLAGTYAEMPMYHAGKAIRENMKRVVEEVLGS